MLPLPACVACYTVANNAGPLTPMQQVLSHKMVGDGLVPLESALGRHEEPGRCLAFAPENQWIAQGVNHLELLTLPGVKRQLVQ